MVEIYSVAVDTKSQAASEVRSREDSRNANRNKRNKNKKEEDKSTTDRVLDDWANASASPVSVDDTASSVNSNGQMVTTSNGNDQAKMSDYYDLLQLTEEMLAGRNAGRTNTVVTALVQYIIRSWRDHYARTVAMKFNCFFLMPFLDEFPAFLRNELDDMYDSNVSEMFDIQEARQALQNRRMELESECAANSKLQRRFDLINAQLSGVGAEDASTQGSEQSSYNGDNKEQVSHDDVNINFMREARIPNFGRWNKQGQTMEDI
jgi:hypothetical protein